MRLLLGGLRVLAAILTDPASWTWTGTWTWTKVGGDICAGSGRGVRVEVYVRAQAAPSTVNRQPPYGEIAFMRVTRA